MAGVLITVFFTGAAATGWWCYYETWKGRIDFYERSRYVAEWFGEWAHVGYNAGLSLTCASFCTGMALLGPLMAAEDAGHPVPHALGIVVGRTAQVFLLGGSSLGISLLLFLFPRFLVPPHLKPGRGWIPESLLQLRVRWDRLRDRR